MKKTVLLLALLLASLRAFAATDTLFISTSQTVHLRFASELKYVNLGDRVLVAKIVDGSKDFVAVKAREAFDFCTSMSCLESNGQMHTFLVAYREHPERLEVDTRLSPPLPFYGWAGAAGYCPGVGSGGQPFSFISIQYRYYETRTVSHRHFRLWPADPLREHLLQGRCAVPARFREEFIGCKLRAGHASICRGERQADEAGLAVREGGVPAGVLRTGRSDARFRGKAGVYL